MGRQPKIRVSYSQDAAFILRLSNAVERDVSRSMEWRKETIALLQRLADRFINAPESK